MTAFIPQQQKQMPVEMHKQTSKSCQTAMPILRNLQTVQVNVNLGCFSNMIRN